MKSLWVVGRFVRGEDVEVWGEKAENEGQVILSFENNQGVISFSKCLNSDYQRGNNI